MRMQVLAGGWLLAIGAALAPGAGQAGELIIGVAPPPVRVEVVQPFRWLQTILFSLIGVTFCSLLLLRLSRHRRIG